MSDSSMINLKISRRKFLICSSASAVAVAAFGASLSSENWVPTLWGDGVTDDTVALQALIDGKPVIRRDRQNAGVDFNTVCLMRGKTYVIGEVTISDGTRIKAG